jgi:hypothetical protein
MVIDPPGFKIRNKWLNCSSEGVAYEVIELKWASLKAFRSDAKKEHSMRANMKMVKTLRINEQAGKCTK